MIKINLSTTKKPVDISNVGGFDFSKLKIKAVILAIALIYIPDFLLVDSWEEERNTAQQEISTKQASLNKLKRNIQQSQSLDVQIKELKAQEDNLRKKLAAVKQAISEKRNPSNILLFLAKNTPPELWVKEITIKNDIMTVKGEAFDYTSIGNFVNGIRSSVFIKDSNIASTSSSVRPSDKKRIETFEVNFTIGSFEQ